MALIVSDKTPFGETFEAYVRISDPLLTRRDLNSGVLNALSVMVTKWRVVDGVRAPAPYYGPAREQIPLDTVSGHDLLTTLARKERPADTAADLMQRLAYELYRGVEAEARNSDDVIENPPPLGEMEQAALASEAATHALLDPPAAPAPPVDVELAAIEDVELARQIVLQRLSAIALGKAGVTIQGFQRVTQLATLQTDDDTTLEEKRDAQLEAAQFAARAAAASPYELARQLKAAKVATLVTIEQLRAYDIYEGWPA